jgi:transposase
MPHSSHDASNITSADNPLYMALKLSKNKWKLAFAKGPGKPRIRTITGWDVEQIKVEIGKSKRRLKLPEDAQVLSCYEAGRDGFCVHRMLEQLQVSNVVIDPASIEVERRKRKRKTDRLDATKLVSRLVRYHEGEPKVWSVVRVPTREQEDARRLHRERERLLKEKKQHQARIRGLLATHGVAAKNVLTVNLVDWAGEPLPPDLRAEIEREQERLRLVCEQLRAVEKERSARLKRRDTPQTQQVTMLTTLRGIGKTSAWVLVMEVFGWRPYENRRKAGSLVGLTGTPYDSRPPDLPPDRSVRFW